MKKVEANTEAKHEFSEKSGQFRLWLGFLLPPVVWAIQLQTVYLLIESGCLTGNFLSIHIVSVITLILSLVGGLISLQDWIKTGGEWKSEKSDSESRSRFMSILGMLMSGLFTLLIFAQWLPALMGVPCEK
jgi:hypothetical protein